MKTKVCCKSCLYGRLLRKQRFCWFNPPAFVPIPSTFGGPNLNIQEVRPPVTDDEYCSHFKSVQRDRVILNLESLLTVHSNEFEL